MKKLLTKKAVNNMNYEILSIGYCDLQHLLKCEDAFGYSTGIYGWSCDYYYSPDYEFIISTGYRTIGKTVNTEIVKKYDNLAKVLIESNLKYEDLKTELQKLISEFIAEVK